MRTTLRRGLRCFSPTRCLSAATISSAAKAQSYLWRTTEPYGSGWPSNGGGRLVGSLATLPYALAEAEQNFLVPAQTQALIWGDLVPQMILSAKIPRWWNVTLGADALGGTAFALRARTAGRMRALDESARQAAMAELGQLAAPARTAQVRRLIELGQVKEAVDQVTPAELFWLAAHLAAGGAPPIVPRCAPKSAPARRKLPSQVNHAAISRAFGAPKPTLANSYRPELLNVRTFPTLMGYSSRILAESWESNNLYWVALADELSLRPAQLNVRIPRVDPAVGRAHFRFSPGGLARTAAVAARGGRRGPRACARGVGRSKGVPSGYPRPGGHNDTDSRRGFLGCRCRRHLAAGPGAAAARLPRQGGHGGAQLPGHRQQEPLHQRPQAGRLPHLRRRHPAENRDLRRRRQHAHGNQPPTAPRRRC